MITLAAVLLPIVAADAMNPMLAAAVIYALGTPRPYRSALWILTGWVGVYFAAGFVLALGLEQILTFLANPRPIDFYIQVPIALGLIVLAIETSRKPDNPRVSQEFHRPTDTARPLDVGTGLALGAGINLIGLPFALPYFAAIDQILKADLDAGGATVMLAVYNLAYVTPFAALGLVRIVYGERAAPIFERVNATMEKLAAVLIPLLLLAVGIALLVDAVLFFATGKPLINIPQPGN